MLGKGLESLIPPHQSKHDAGQAPQNFRGDGAGQAPNGGGDEKKAEARVSPSVPLANQAPVVAAREPESAMAVAEKPLKKPAAESIFHIEVSKIKPNPNQPRRKFNEEGLRELANSVREFGFIQPLVVSKSEKETPTGIDVEYELLAGERRLLAAKILGLEVVPAIVRNVDLEQEKLELAVVENIQRENLNSIEMARALQRLQEEFRMTQREIASKLGKSREAVANTVRLLDLPPYIQEALEKGQISESHGRLLLAVPDPGAQRRLFEDLLMNRLTTRELKERVRTAKPRKERSAPELTPELKMMQEKLSAELGAPVMIEAKGETKTVKITFYSEEELQNLIRKLGGRDDSAL